jgi:hypothetical protein
LTKSDLGKAFLDEYHSILPERTHILHPEEDVDSFLKNIEFDGTPYIVRGRHPDDFVGAVDVFQTHSDTFGIFTAKKVKELISTIRSHASSDIVKSFMQYDIGKDFNGKSGIMVQKYY